MIWKRKEQVYSCKESKNKESQQKYRTIVTEVSSFLGNLVLKFILFDFSSLIDVLKRIGSCETVPMYRLKIN